MITANGSQTALDLDVVAAISGDREAFGRLVSAYANTVTSITLAIVRDLNACEDIAQEVFLSAWANLNKLKNPHSFLPWIRQTARNLANTWIRDRMRERALSGKTDALLEEAADPRMDTAARMLEAEEIRLLYEVIESLPDDAREVVTLYYREGRSISQVAGLLDLREEAVRQRLSRARSRLREELLERFGTIAKRTTSGALLTAAVMASLGTASTTVTAGAAAAGASMAVGLGLLGKFGAGFLCAIPGALGGLTGVYSGFRQEIRQEQDPEARRALTRSGVLLAIAVIACALAISVTGLTHQLWVAIVGYSAFTFVVTLIYWVEVPKITAPRRARELAHDPAMAAVHARQLNWKRLQFGFGVTTGWAGMGYALWTISP